MTVERSQEIYESLPEEVREPIAKTAVLLKAGRRLANLEGIWRNKTTQQPRWCGTSRAIWTQDSRKKERHGLEGYDSWERNLHKVLITLNVGQAKVRKMLEKSQREALAARSTRNA